MRNRYEQEAEEVIYLCLKHNLMMTLFANVQLRYFDYGSSVKSYTSEEILLDSVKLIFFPISYNRSWTHLIGNVSSKMRRNEAGS